MSETKSTSKKRRHEVESASNREVVESRSRQWVTVGDSSDDEQMDDSTTCKQPEINSKQPIRSGDDVDNDNDDDADLSSDSSDSSSSSDHRREKKRKSKSHSKHSKSSKDSKSKKHKKDKRKKDKKDKKSKLSHRSDSDDERHSRSKPSAVVNQDNFGKYGILREEHYYLKQREFEFYMQEVKRIPDIFGQGRFEVMKYFKEFIEDYNTATMPHVKFYNYEKWETDEYQRQKALTAQQLNTEKCEGDFNDESDRRREMARLKQSMEQREFEMLKSKMVSNKEQRESMRRQDQLKGELQSAFKQGDVDRVKRIEKLLAPDEEGPAVKHPWA